MGGEGSILVLHETHFCLKQAGSGLLWGPSCSHPHFSDIRQGAWAGRAGLTFPFFSRCPR